MTLLELPVKELPKRGGWLAIFRVFPDCNVAEKFISDFKVYYGTDSNCDQYIESEETAEILTREQYEAAIAAQQPVWNGEGLPPVGVLVELMDDSQSQAWGDVTIKYYGDSFAVWDDHGEEFANSLCHVKVRPIRTEAERERDEAIAEMASTPKPCGHAIYDICAQLYDAGYRKSGVPDDRMG